MEKQAEPPGLPEEAGGCQRPGKVSWPLNLLPPPSQSSRTAGVPSSQKSYLESILSIGVDLKTVHLRTGMQQNTLWWFQMPCVPNRVTPLNLALF